MADEPKVGADAPFTLVYLDIDDEITSAAARIRGANAERVALVLPYGSRLATSRINLRLLAREATERGKHLEVICADSSARALAIAAGLPVYPSVAAFEGRGAPSVAEAAGASGGTGASAGDGSIGAGTIGRGAGGAAGAATDPKRFGPDDTGTRVLAVPRRSSPKVPLVGPPRPPVKPRLAIGAGIALLVAVIVGAFVAIDVLPTATIVLHPRSEAIGPIELTVEARPDVATPDAAALAIPAQLITFNLEASDTYPATGIKTVRTKATGNVRFSNFDTGSANRIDAGAIVKTPDGIGFVTLASVSLPNATIEFPFTIRPSTSTVGVEAVESGPAGNVGNNTITVIPKGENKRLLEVTNVDATAGGAITESPQVSASDVEAATAAIRTALVAEFDQQVAESTGVPAGLTLFPETRLLAETEFAVDPETIVGTEAAEFDLAGTAEGSALAVDPTPIEALAEARLDTRVRSGWTLIPETIAPVIGTPSIVGGTIVYPVTISGTQVHDVDQAGLVAAIKGLVLAEARTHLEAVGDANVTLWPDWVTRIPTHEDQITLTLGAPQPSAPPEQ